MPGDINVSANSPDQDEYAKPNKDVKCFHKLLNISIGCFISWQNLYLYVNLFISDPFFTFRPSQHLSMKKNLSQSDKDHLNQLVAEAEKRTNAQIVLAVVKRSDSYAEIPWKAFAIGTSVAGLLLFLLNATIPSWYTPARVLIVLAATLATGISLALLTVFVPLLARLFLSSHRAETEVKQHAESIFISHGVFVTRKRIGVLIFVSLFERKVFILPDKGLCNLLGDEETSKIMKPMLASLRQHELRKAFEAGLNELSGILQNSIRQVPDGSGENELPNEIIEEEGV